MRAAIIATGLAFLVIGPVSAKPLPASDAEKSAAMHAYLACLDAEAAKKDDGQVEPEVLSAIIAPMCREQLGSGLIDHSQ